MNEVSTISDFWENLREIEACSAMQSAGYYDVKIVRKFCVFKFVGGGFNCYICLGRNPTGKHEKMIVLFWPFHVKLSAQNNGERK